MSDSDSSGGAGGALSPTSPASSPAVPHDNIILRTYLTEAEHSSPEPEPDHYSLTQATTSSKPTAARPVSAGAGVRGSSSQQKPPRKPGLPFTRPGRLRGGLRGSDRRRPRSTAYGGVLNCPICWQLFQNYMELDEDEHRDGNGPIRIFPNASQEVSKCVMVWPWSWCHYIHISVLMSVAISERFGKWLGRIWGK